MKIFYCFLFLSSLLISNTCGQSKTDNIDKLVSTYAEYGQFNGSILVSEKGKVIYKKGFGFANVELGVPNQADTKFRLASITKQFTAMLIIQLAAENKLRLDAPISTYLPDYPGKNGDIITTHHLLTHTSGIPNYTSAQSYGDIMRDPHTPEEIISLFASSELEFSPGAKFQYSNSGYILLGHLIEKITGKPYEEVLKNEILVPLKMNNTGYDHHSNIIKNRASGYYQSGSHFQNAHYIDMSVPFAAGSIYSTVEDMYLWDQALYTEQLAPKKYMDLLFTQHILNRNQYYGYGWELWKMPLGTTEEKIDIIGHHGGINGFNTVIARIPADQSLIVLLSNTGNAPLDEMMTGISGILYGKPFDLPKRSVAYVIQEMMEKDGMEAATSHYARIKHLEKYYLNEYEMNTAGYYFLQSGKPKEASVIFRMNVDAFPASFNAYDSYGEALLALGDTAKAIENYTQSVTLNPGNENGQRILRALGVRTHSNKYTPSIESLKMLEGEYTIMQPAHGADEQWKIVIDEVNGELTGNDRGYRYKLLPVSENKFINPDDGASLEFDTSDKEVITLLLFGKFRFRKSL